MADPDAPAQARLEEAIAAQEGLRGTLGDAIVDATIDALRVQLDILRAESQAHPRRRQATVVFVDVVDSTDLLRDRDPEETMVIMDSALERLAEPIRAHGGRVTRFMGDGYLAVFGLPISRENDPEMAVRAGLAVQEEAAEIARELHAGEGLGPFRVRVGINTGLVVSGGSTEAEDTIMGAEVNLAARLESAAPPGGVLISHGTLQHVRDICVVEERGTIDAKGFPEPVPVYLVSNMVETRLPGARQIVPGIGTPMVGRDGEIASLRDALVGARDARTIRVISVSGPPGTGKSRLVHEFEDTLGDDVRHMRARVGPDDRDVPYALIRDLLNRRLNLRINDPVEVVRRKLVDGMAPDLGDDGEEKAILVGRLAGFELGGAVDDPQQMRDRALAHLATYMEPRPGQAATVLVADDLHWADEASLDALARLADLLSTAPVLVVAVARPELWAGDGAKRLDRHRINLGPLDEAAAAELVDTIVTHIDGDTFALQRLLLDGAEGNPHFLEELLRMLVDDGALVRSDGRWAVEAGALKGFRVPPSLTGVVQARLDALDPDERSLLQRAAVVGRVFWTPALERLGEGSEVGELLRRLSERGMVGRQDVSTLTGTDEYRFRHTVLREVAYESVLIQDRRLMHGIAADWLLEQAGERLGEMTGIIATHLEKAGREEEALVYLVRAAEAARAGYAVVAAADFYDRALALADADDLAQRYDLLLGRQEVAGLQGESSLRMELLDRLDAVAETLGDIEKQARVAVERTWVELRRGEFEAALAASGRAADLAAVGGDSKLESRARSARAWALLSLDDLDRAAGDAQAALALAQQGGSAEYEAAARNALGMILVARGDPSAASAHLEQALDLALAQDDRGGGQTFLNNLAVARMLLGDYDGAWAHFAQARDLAVAAGDESGTASAYTNLAWAAGSRESWEVARDAAQRALPMKRRQGHHEAVAETLLWLGHALVGLGSIDEALEVYGESMAIRENLAQTSLVLGVRAGIVRAHLAGGAIADAVSGAEPIIHHLEQGGSLDGTWEPMRIWLTCVEALEAAGDERADEMLAKAVADLEERASQIEDRSDRRMFLEAVPWHRELMERAGRR